MNEIENKEEIELSQEDIDMVFTGKRPDTMPYQMFRAVRSELSKATKQRLKGTMFHVSSWLEEIPEENVSEDKIEPKYRRVTKTYIKPKEDDLS